MKGDTSTEKESYGEFVDEFKPKKTTDDCCTPPEIHDAAADHVTERFGVRRADMARPFHPGGDFEALDHPDGRRVVDNPPFSILGKTKRFHIERGIPFFMFASTPTSFSSTKTVYESTHHPCGARRPVA